MIIEPRVVHDLKTERPDVAPPLPATMRAIPLAFYLSALACVVLSAVFMLQLVKARTERDDWKSRATAAQTELTATKASRAALESEAKRASDFLAWVEGSRMVQPLVATIARSMGEKSSIVQLALERNDENPTQIRLKLKLLADHPDQLDRTLEAIAQDGFRAYSAQQTHTGGAMDYEATLIWQGAKQAPAVEAQPL